MIDLGSETSVVPFEESDLHEATIVVVAAAEIAECSCPEFCERDHDVD